MTPPRNWHKWLMLSLLGLALSARTIGCDYSSITEKFGAEAVAHCNEKCPFQNRTGDDHFDLSCGSDCSIQQCNLGCRLWREGLEQSCQSTCNATSETVVSHELYCVMGCNEALNTYYQKLRELISTPPAPALLADSLTATSLSLLWEAPDISNLTYMVQWRYEELPGTWQYYSNSSHKDRSVVSIENLRPYTKYRFRVAIFLSGRGAAGEPVYSAPSVVISTLESGRPSSPPEALRAAAPDPSRVAISWESGPFPNGPLISYVLRLVDTQPNIYAALEDMPASNNTLFYMFQNLAPAREYEVSVAMRNAVGEGPQAYVRVQTPEPIAAPSEQPTLILGGQHKILAAQANDMLSDPIELYSTKHNITGVGLDISSDYLFVSDTSGHVYRTSLSKKSPSMTILSPDNISYKPLDLSVDWLNHHLYVLGEVYYKRDNTGLKSVFSNWEILRCDFDGKNQLVALAGFNTKPVHFEVDPYNGYLFWSVRGVERGGLYRLDLANISNGVRYDAPPELIVRDAQLGAFTVDHADFRLLVAHLQKNTVLAVSLDGREVSNFRNNTQSPMFQSARSIAFAGGLFYWTNGEEMLAEEYHAESDSYFHNEYPLSRNTNMMKVLVQLRSCQPIPVPVNPPLNVQSVMGISRAKVSWAPPHRLGHQGSGAWQHWSYHLQLTHAESGDVMARKDINGSIYIVENLIEDSEYIIKVAAVTESGRGPWSAQFVGRTLASTPTTLHSTLIWSGPDGLLQTDLTGDNLQTLIHRAHLKDLHITDISWYRDKLYLVTNASTVLWYNTTTHEKGLMPNMDNVGSLAVDWVGKRIYWSNPKQQLITRGNLEGGNREPVPIVTVAKELTIDSLRAYIYWNTGHAVEAARLNGENKIVYYPAQLFSGKQVMGLTVDFEQRWLYWLVRSYDGSELHKAPTADRINQNSEEISASLVTRMAGLSTLGPLCYFSGRLLWVQDPSRAVISDLNGRYTADLVPRVQVIAVRDPTLHAQSEKLVAIPETINATSLAVLGSWESFNVTWNPAARVNHGRVYYDVSLKFENQKRIERTVENAWLEIHDTSIPPYSGIEATVRAHTPWGGGAAARASLRTPQAAPSAPTSPRLYLQPFGYSGDGSPMAVFRWNSPSKPNGRIRGFETQCWMLLVKASSTVTPARPPACASDLQATQTQLILRDLMPNTTYYFKVRAYTDADFGPYSEVVSASSNTVNPIPKVIISSQEAIKLIDLDSNDSLSISKSTGTPNDFSISIEENVIYWANNLEEIFSSRINGSGNYKLTSINGSASSVCVDWVGRVIYWAQMETISIETYVIYRTELTLHNTRPHFTRLFATRRPVYNLQIAPLTRTLYWYEESSHEGLGTLMTTNIDKIDIRPFFDLAKDQAKLRSINCNCPENPQVAKSFVLDMTMEGKHELYWVDPLVYHIYASDMNGCKCRSVVSAEAKEKHGFIPLSISVDSKNVYWFNATEKYIYYTDKEKRSRIEKTKVFRGYKIAAFDPRIQPYPPKHCLFPKVNALPPKLLKNTPNSITLQLPPVRKHEECVKMDFEMAISEYTIYYRAQIKNETACDKKSCTSISTIGNEVTLMNLTPFTNYLVIVEVTNYYAKLHEVRPLSAPPVVYRTAAEAPEAPRDVLAAALSPEMARVEWTSEPGLSYEVHWRTNDFTFSPHNFKEHNAFVVPEGRVANISRLSPNTSYSVWVRTRSNHSVEYADSRPIPLRTYPLPTMLTLINTTAYEIRISWPLPTTYSVAHYEVEYSAVIGTGKWSTCKEGERRGQWVANRLRPRTRYKFRLKLQYTQSASPYYWPPDDRFTFETLGDRPGAPSAPRVEAVGDRMIRAWWSEPDPRGEPVLAYRVWGRSHIRTSQTNVNMTTNLSHTPPGLPEDVDDELKIKIIREGLELLHNGTENYWLIASGELSGRYSVWVQARNALGWGALSPSGELDASALAVAARPPHAAATLAAAVAALVALALTVAAGFLFMYKNRSKKKAALESQNAIGGTRRGPDVELATLRQLPIRHSTNILYNQQGGHPVQAELAALPHIRRDQITLTKFLGSGAFGEVFEGVARRLSSDGSDTKVAVKTLRKGATDQEKSEFLQEAALMSNFKHEHILRLLGVCLDNDPNFIIMELMEGGDLLSYLRTKRASLYTPDSLSLLDLLNMCVDVTKGCRYLEEMHFVHRDLACRNCLVAQRGSERVVKIGDFGLARDIYKNDYYRKEGEGLLPVRWMAVECLVDGVFSCQSDVWAWGVLCWEVLSLGQQPYPARTNRQVLAYVRAGGTPTRPPNCPSVFYELLQRCWSYSPEQRPTFKHCLEVVTALRDKTSPNITLTVTAPAAAPPHYLTLLADDEDFSEHQMEPSRLLPERAPKYLELMHDSDSGAGIVCDGYEVPRARHSVIGVAPYRLVRPAYRTHSLRAQRPPNATIIPLRSGLAKRASFCDSLLLDPTPPRPARRVPPPDYNDTDMHTRDQVFKTPF